MELPDLDTAKWLSQFGLLAMLWLRVEVRLARLESAVRDHLKGRPGKTLSPLLLLLIPLVAAGCRTQMPQSGSATFTYPPGSVVLVWTNASWLSPDPAKAILIVEPAPN